MADTTTKKEIFEALIRKIEAFEHATETAENLEKYQTSIDDAIDDVAKISEGKIDAAKGKKLIKDILELIRKERDNPKDRANEDLRDVKFKFIWNWTKGVAFELKLKYDWDENKKWINVDVTLGILSSEVNVEYVNKREEIDNNEDPSNI